MKLTVFNNESFPKGSFGRSGASPAISMGKAGNICINSGAAERLGLQHEDKISFAQDEEDPANWYVFKDDNGYPCRLHSDKKSLVFSHGQMVRSIKESLGLDTLNRSAEMMSSGIFRTLI